MAGMPTARKARKLQGPKTLRQNVLNFASNIDYLLDSLVEGFQKLRLAREKQVMPGGLIKIAGHKKSKQTLLWDWSQGSR